MSTIIAAKDRIIGDRQCNAPEGIHEATKVHRLSDGRVMGFAGCVEFIGLVKQFLETGEKFDVPDKVEFSVLVSDGDSMIYLNEYLVPMSQEGEYFAVGTGAQFALGAMRAGAGMTEALDVAKELDNKSGMGTDDIPVMLSQPVAVEK